MNATRRSKASASAEYEAALARIEEELLPVLEAVAAGDTPDAVAGHAASIAIRAAGGTDVWRGALIESHDAHMHNWKAARARVAELEAALAEAERERDHWKHLHDQQVGRKRATRGRLREAEALLERWTLAHITGSVELRERTGAFLASPDPKGEQ